ncbi:4-hydroxy-tetrahydrodipicolinate synthase [Dokdonia sp. Hel_I_53]|uniref:4-hydroxy-tetrahydrodipicolinate synthase n=1 Tax=Dokdonia sp. Hel_I_53 TaxID=1566287 RepID=UPI00119BF0D1|nr:4-hydroxy-tetrahydrodipicolinate synthase [Dokdonia sp. Hel_I_53]TVZ53265.1 4-hydroxy-tetrahydrodipicolinate synthase [Dokdonia sp. Hel_I_53]
MQLLRGLGVALVTPFNEDLSIDFSGLTKLLEYNISNGTDYFVVMGTTAESATLTAVEKREVLDHVIRINNGRLPIVLGIGGNHTTAVVREIEETNLDGVTAILSVSPCYNKPTQEGIYQHFSAIAKVSPLPVILYNVPGRTASNMLPTTVARLARDFKNIVGVKEAIDDMAQVLKLLHDVPEGFIVLSGDDALAPSLISAGGQGVISVIGQGLPKAFGDVISGVRNGDERNAYKEHLQLLEVIDLIFEEGNPAGIKALLSHLEICKPYVRLPLVVATDDLTHRISSFMKDL